MVAMLEHKRGKGYSFVNLTKEHICLCVFKTIKEAEEDLDKYVNNKKVVDWYKKELFIELDFKNK